MSKPQRHGRGEGVKVPAWASLVTYLICWSLGVYLVVTASAGDWQRLAAALFFVIWPISGTTPLELVRAWRGDG